MFCDCSKTPDPALLATAMHSRADFFHSGCSYLFTQSRLTTFFLAPLSLSTFLFFYTPTPQQLPYIYSRTHGHSATHSAIVGYLMRWDGFSLFLEPYLLWPWVPLKGIWRKTTRCTSIRGLLNRGLSSVPRPFWRSVQLSINSYGHLICSV